MDRRQLLITGAAALTAATGTPAQAASIFAGTALADNRLAKRFLPPIEADVSKVKLVGDDGPHYFGELTGKVRIVALWAEWCTPCLVEAGDLARLHATYGGDAFGVQSILTGSDRGLNVKGARKILEKTHGDSLPLWVEPMGGSRIGRAFAWMPAQPLSLPCALLIDRGGRVRGRCIGLGFAGDAPIKPNDKKAIMRRKTEWSTPEADAFVQGLINGVLG